MSYVNCSGDVALGLPVTKDYFDALYTSEKAFIGVSIALTALTMGLAIKIAVCNSKTLKQCKQIRVTGLWMVALCPLLSVLALISLIVPRAFLLRDILMTGCLSVAIYKFVHHIKACIRYDDKEDELLASPVHLDVPPFCCCCKCLPTLRPTDTVMAIVKGVLLQYPFVSTSVAVLTMCLWLNEEYTVGESGSSNAYPFLQAIKILSTLSAMFALGVYYKLSSGICQDYHQVGKKYAGLKLTLLFVNVQDVIFSIMLSRGVFSDRNCVPAVAMSNYVQDVVFTFEMFLVALLNHRAYQSPIDAPPAHKTPAADLESNSRQTDDNSVTTGKTQRGSKGRSNDGIAKDYEGSDENGIPIDAVVA